MTLKQLTYFLKIAELGNLTRAAEDLNMSQPPLSYQLKTLEDELGVTLFIRESHSMRITDEGIYLRDKATQILSLVDRTTNEMRAFNENQPFTVNIGTVPSSGHNFLPGTVKTFKKHHPNASFNIYEGNSMRLQELLHNSVIDIALLREPFPTDQYDSILLQSSNLNKDYDNDYFIAVGTETYMGDPGEDTIELSQVLDMPLVVHRKFEDLLNIQARGIGRKVSDMLCRNDNITASIEWAANELGVAIMPFTSSMLINNDRLIVKRIVNPSFYSNLYIVWKKDAVFNKHAKAFLDMCKKYPNIE